MQKGLGDKDAEMDIYINPLELSASSINENITTHEGLIKETIQITTLDKECINRTVGLIKMDIEGAEYSAIKGALETIKRDKPVLLISLYHTAKDFSKSHPCSKRLFQNINFALSISKS